MKKLVFRLSSLGDVVLATAALEAASMAGGAEVHWVTLPEYASLLEGHPRIRKVWVFDKKTGLAGWLKLCRELRGESFDEVHDLHLSLRTRMARLAFFVWGAVGAKASPRWTSYAKDRWRFYGYCLFKGLWPVAFRPRPVVARMARAAGGSGQERPDLRHLLKRGAPSEGKTVFPEGQYLCVMPGARWPGKRWSLDGFEQALKGLRGLTPVVLGASSDRESVELVERLKTAGISAVSGVGRWNLPETAAVLAGSAGYLGNDTGLGHLAEAVGVPVAVVFGPTKPDLGFGPWRKESRAVGSALWCRPCGKDGRYCFRPIDRYRCLREVEPEEVSREVLGVRR